MDKRARHVLSLPREASIEKTVNRMARERGWLERKFTSPGRRSAPDRYWLRNGVLVFVEYKSPGKKPTRAQMHEHATIRAHGGRVFVVDSVGAGKRLLDALDAERDAPC